VHGAPGASLIHGPWINYI